MNIIPLLASKIISFKNPIISWEEIKVLIIESCIENKKFVYDQKFLKTIKRALTHPETFNEKNIFFLIDEKLIVPSFCKLEPIDGFINKNIWLTPNKDRPLTKELLCLIDKSGYLSHLSALNYWKLSETSNSIVFTRPDAKLGQKLEEHYLFRMNEKLITLQEKYKIFNFKQIPFPDKIKNYKINCFFTKKINDFSGIYYDSNQRIRVSSIGNTFIDSIENPDLCGGLLNVLNIWKYNSAKHIDAIINTINRKENMLSHIFFCRAGFILEEIANINDSRIKKWKIHKRRGGSSKLDISQPYNEKFSSEWDISINIKLP